MTLFKSPFYLRENKRLIFWKRVNFRIFLYPCVSADYEKGRGYSWLKMCLFKCVVSILSVYT
jgi:hypothetical protein